MDEGLEKKVKVYTTNKTLLNLLTIIKKSGDAGKEILPFNLLIYPIEIPCGPF